MLVPREERLRLLPSLTIEGNLQAHEIARRVLGLGHDDEGSGEDVERAFLFGPDRQAFRRWLKGRLGVWVDYLCMPQAPFGGGEAEEFRRGLRALDGLVSSSTLIALRRNPVRPARLVRVGVLPGQRSLILARDLPGPRAAESG